MLALRELDMAKKDQSVRLPADVLKMARLLAVYEDVNIGEVIAEAARPVLEKKMKEHKLPIPPKVADKGE